MDGWDRIRPDVRKTPRSAVEGARGDRNMDRWMEQLTFCRIRSMDGMMDGRMSVEYQNGCIHGYTDEPMNRRSNQWIGAVCSLAWIHTPPPLTRLDFVTYVLSMSVNPSPKPFPMVAAVAIATAVHVTSGCTALEMPRGTRVPAVNPNKVDSSIDNCAAGLAALANIPGPRPDAPNTATTPDADAPAASRRMSGERNVGGAGFDEEAAEAVEAAGVGVVGFLGERAPTTVAVEARLKNQPPQTSSRSLAALAVEGAGDSGRTTRLGTKNTGSHLQRGTEVRVRVKGKDKG